jgi:ATP-dependent RNA/DNA helicase IGHMBP2
MNYFEQLGALLKIERQTDQQQYQQLTAKASVIERRENGLTWYPIAIRGTEIGRGDYLTVEVERTTHQDIPHQLRTGTTVAIFSNHNAAKDRIEGTVTFLNANRLGIALRTEDLPDWASDGKLGIDLLFDDNSYDEMQEALKQASKIKETTAEGRIINILIGEKAPSFDTEVEPIKVSHLNESQTAAVQKIVAANELAIVHGPPGTGKTTTLVQAIKTLANRDHKQILVVAPSNTSVDLLSEKLSDEGLNVLRVGNPAKVSEHLLALTLDRKMAAHSQMKQIKELKKRANAFKDMAHKYKRSFGRAEREQRKALFDEAKKIMKEVGNTEQYIVNNLIESAQIITATLVGANHYTVRHLKYHTVVIDEAGQALEPACWIPILKAQKLILAGDHCQLPPTIKSDEAAKAGLATTLLEKCVRLHPQTVTLLEEQYRMHQTIMQYPSAVFYQNKLKAHSSVANNLLFTTDLPLTFVDTAGCGFDEKKEGMSVSNPEEAAFVMKHLTQLVEELKKQQPKKRWSIAVIAPYRQQIEALKAQLSSSPLLQAYEGNIAINTVDSFQGQERDIVYISMTRSNADGSIGFLADIRRMNVAMTRARKKLVAIGDSATLSKHPFYRGFIDFTEKIEAYKSAWEWMDL